MKDKQSDTRSIRIHKDVYKDVKVHVAEKEDTIKDFVEMCIRKVLPEKKKSKT
jgi:flagellar motor switch/type III secretory pathway protein FliN